ncbi:hypothetical protein [Pontixanthobacter sp. CEM42]|uniref:hypothetical protein n=1 Tax=Pontixanthobacter sp. CEM42 TaxID=2792077 RepID=UPI001AE0C0EF|nr:hypothetical protein [Pontixanthobacter sp. CEM42]
MKNITSLAISIAALSLTACGGGASESREELSANAEEQEAVMTESEKRQAKTQCRLEAMTQGAPDDKAKELCECVVETLAIGRTGTEFEDIAEGPANEALNKCAEQAGLVPAE